jgi:hypothetical protein
MNRLLIFFLAFSPFSAANPIHLFCEGYETTNLIDKTSTPVAASHSVMLNKIKGTIAISFVTAPYHAADSKDAYRAMYKDKDGLDHFIELNRHSLSLLWRYSSGKTFLSFRGQCTTLNLKI